MLLWVLNGLGVVCLFFVILAFAGFAFERWSELRDARVLMPDGETVDIGGRRLHIYCTGQSGPTAILEAGGGTPSLVSRALQAKHAQFARVCSYDRVGLGWSDPATGPRSFEEEAQDLAALLKNADIRPPYILVAESYGGLVARTFIRQRPEAVSGLVLIDAAEEQHAFGKLLVLRSQSQQAWGARWLAELGVMRLLVSSSPTLGLIPSPDRIRLAKLMSPPSHWKAVRQELQAYELTPEAQRVAGGFGSLGELPLVVIRHGRPFLGAQAVIEEGWTEAQTRLASLSTDSRLIVAEKSGHAISLEQPDIVIEAVRWIAEATADRVPE